MGENCFNSHMKIAHLFRPQPNMSLIREACNSLGKTSLTSLVGHHWATGGLWVNSFFSEERTYKLSFVPAWGECNIVYDSCAGESVALVPWSWNDFRRNHYILPLLVINHVVGTEETFKWAKHFSQTINTCTHMWNCHWINYSLYRVSLRLYKTSTWRWGLTTYGYSLV